MLEIDRHSMSDGTSPAPAHRLTLAGATWFLLRHPTHVLLRRWNWKSPFLSCLFRGSIFFALNITAGLGAALAAMVTEMGYRVVVSGFFASVTQWFRLVQPAWKGALTVMVVIPAVNHTLEFIVHWISGTPQLTISILVSACVSALSASFQFFIMRQGVLIVEPGSASLSRDLTRLPRAIVRLPGQVLQGSGPSRNVRNASRGT